MNIWGVVFKRVVVSLVFGLAFPAINIKQDHDQTVVSISIECFGLGHGDGAKVEVLFGTWCHIVKVRQAVLNP
jgi:hypothetical protein